MRLFSIARTSLTKMHLSSRVILLDEVTSHLDDEAEARAISVMNIAFEECTVMNFSHRQETQDGDDVVFRVRNGSVTVRGGTQEAIVQNAASLGPGFPGMPHFRGFGAALDPDAPIADPPPRYSATSSDQPVSKLDTGISHNAEQEHPTNQSLALEGAASGPVDPSHASSSGHANQNSAAASTFTSAEAAGEDGAHLAITGETEANSEAPISRRLQQLERSSQI